MLLWSDAGQGVCGGEGLKALGVGTDGLCTVEHDTEISAINDKSIQIIFFKQICLLNIIIECVHLLYDINAFRLYHKKYLHHFFMKIADWYHK